MRAKTIWRRAALAGVAAIVTIGSVASFAAGAPPSQDENRAVLGCARFTASVDTAESHEVFDQTTGRLLIDAGGASYVLTEGDAGCRANQRALRRLANARLVEQENRRDQCSAFRQAITEGRTTEKGRPVNLGAAQRFVNEECS